MKQPSVILENYAFDQLPFAAVSIFIERPLLPVQLNVRKEEKAEGGRGKEKKERREWHTSLPELNSKVHNK